MSTAGPVARRDSVGVQVGPVVIGGGHPVVVQSMTNTDTADVDATVEQVADKTRIGWNLNIDCIFDCPHRGQSMGVRSDPAGALHEMVGIARIASLKNQLDSSKHLS